MKYFTNCKTLDDLKAEYRRLAKRHHPDLGGDKATMQAINAEYETRFEILKKQSGQKRLEPQYIQKDSQYVEVRIPMPQLKLTEEQARDLFNPSKEHIPYLLCRQIVRDHGEATNRRGCGIWAEVTDGITYIKLTLPRYGKL